LSSHRQVFLESKIPGKKFKNEKVRLEYCRNVLKLATTENQHHEEGVTVLMSDALATHAEAIIIETGKEESVEMEEKTEHESKHQVKDALRSGA
jgi:hypothetical protein